MKQDVSTPKGESLQTLAERVLERNRTANGKRNTPRNTCGTAVPQGAERDTEQMEQAERRRDDAAVNAWTRLQAAYLRAGQPSGWLTSDLLFLEDVVSKLWVSSRTDPTDDQRFHVALHRWEAIAIEAIAAAADADSKAMASSRLRERAAVICRF